MDYFITFINNFSCNFRFSFNFHCCIAELSAKCISKTDPVPVHSWWGGGGGETRTLLGPLERANLNHWMLLEDENRSVFLNIVFSTYLEFWKIDKINKPSDADLYAIVTTF
jgi:hypothetical protein